MTAVLGTLWAISLLLAFMAGMYLQYQHNRRHIQRLAETVRVNQLKARETNGRW